MALLLLWLASLLITSLHSFVDTDWNIVTNRTLDVGERMTLVSSGFPECCAQDFIYSIDCGIETCGFKILFIDVDLPERSKIEVYDGWSSERNLLAASTLESTGVWTRPSLVHAGNTLAVVLVVEKHMHYDQHAGVKIHLEAYDTVLDNVTPPVTSIAVCGSMNLAQTWKGGKIVLVPNAEVEEATFDCIWVLSTPSDVDGIKVFLRITDTNNVQAMEIRRGTNSAAPEMLYLNAANGPAVTMHAMEVFSSADGLYVRIRKPQHSGKVAFIYGLYTELTTDRHKGHCRMTSLGGVDVYGFICEQDDWCISPADVCDGINQCTNGADERGCKRLPATVVPTTKASHTTKSSPQPAADVCRAWEKSCPDGSCVLIFAGRCFGECFSWEVKCPDGKCVVKGMQCSGECRAWEHKCADGSCILGDQCLGECLPMEKKCPDGLCINKYKYCPSEPCPPDMKHRCSDLCYGDDEQCNQVEYCKDGSDENFCSIPSLWQSSFTWIAVPMLVAILVVIICVLYAIRKRSGSRDESYQGQITNCHSGLGEFTGESDSMTVDVTDSPTAPLTCLTDSQAPPPYTEAVHASGYPLNMPMGASSQVLPPPYEQVTTIVKPPKVDV